MGFLHELLIFFSFFLSFLSATTDKIVKNLFLQSIGNYSLDVHDAQINGQNLWLLFVVRRYHYLQIIIQI